MRLLILAITLSAAMNSLAGGCATIEEALARLECYERISSCGSVQTATARLLCFEAADTSEPSVVEMTSSPANETSVAGQVRLEAPAPIVETAPEVVSEVEPIVSKVEPIVTEVDEDDRNFPVKSASSNAPERDAPESEPKITAEILSFEKDHNGVTYVTLDNGQVWREISRGRFNYKTGLSVVITKGFGGSTNMQVTGMRKYVKVKRIR